jgi:2-keto-4-pentenoate hydratase/2-oxohepta-3-ene-1,7-dioic acid hydratase in catechol pathway
MKLVRYQQGQAVSYGELEGDRITPLTGELGALKPSGAAAVALGAVKLLAPVTPSKIIAIGPNFKVYFQDGSPAPPQPILWSKPATCLNNPEGVIELPPGETCNHESEIAMVIGKTARLVAPKDYRDYVLGYTCMNDVTAGDFSTRTSFASTHHFVDGKIFEGFAPLGPCIVTDLDSSALKIECRVNGTVRQSHTTADFLFSEGFVLSMISKVMTLYPGDVISMGSPPGVQPLEHGDVVEVEVEGIGVLRNSVRRRD